MARRVTPVVLLCLLATGVAGCGSSGTHAKTPRVGTSSLASVQSCLKQHGYQVSAESPAVRRTAPRRFGFVAVWNLLNPDRIALAVTISKDGAGAARAAAWTRRENAKLGKGVVQAPVVQFGRIDVLWTAQPSAADKSAIYGCVRMGS